MKNTFTVSRFARTLMVGALVAGTGLALSACTGLTGVTGSNSAPGALGACPSSLSSTHRFVAVITDSSAERAARLTSERWGALSGFVESAASCRGTLSVIFDPGQSLTSTLYSGQPFASAATAIAAQHRTVALLTNTVLPEIRAALRHALTGPAPSVASPQSAFQVAADELAGASGHADVLVLSDFVVQDTTLNLNQPLSLAQGARLASRVTVPSLRGDHVQIEGVGQSADTTPAPQEWIAAISTFARDLCRRTGATCTVSTQVLS